MFSCGIFVLFAPMLDHLGDLPWFVLLFYASFIGHAIFVGYFHLRFLLFQKKPAEFSVVFPPISVLIAARNEADHLSQLIPVLMSQNYPCFEVIVVDHQSTDETLWLIQRFQQQYANFFVVEIPKNVPFRPGKKMPLSLGIQEAKYDHFVLTDADCCPVSEDWLRHMAQGFVSNKEIVLGYGPYTQRKGFLNRLIRFDTAAIAVNYFGFALARIPFMGVGRNLAYSRQVFDEVNGFSNHEDVASGDDDLFIQQSARRRNYTVQIHPDSFCYSEPHSEWSDWLRQKTRHYSTASKYKVIKKSLLGIYPFTLWCMTTSFILLCLTNSAGWIEVLTFASLLWFKWLVQGLALSKLKESKLAWFFPFWDYVHALVIPWIYLSTRKAKTTW